MHTFSTELQEAIEYQLLSADYAQTARLLITSDGNKTQASNFQLAAAYAAHVARTHLFYMLEAQQIFRG